MRAAAAPALVLLLAAASIAGCVAPGSQPSQNVLPPLRLPFLGDGPPVPMTFGAPVVVDAAMGASEPSLVVDPEGRIFVAAPTGLASGDRLSGQFWRSEDGGASFQHLPGLGVAGLYGPSIGGGDSDIASDAQGNLYAIDLWLGNVGFLASQDHGESWRGSPVTFATPGTDRQWIDVHQGTGDVYITVNSLSTGLWVARSTDMGLTFPQQTLATPHGSRGGCVCPPGVLVVEEGSGNLYLPYYVNPRGVGLAVSRDGGASFENLLLPGSDTGHLADDDAGELGGSFVAAAHDAAGNVYVAWESATPQGRRIVLQASADGGTSWTEPVVVSAIPQGEQIFPWLAAGGAGRVAVAWYEVVEERWDVRLASSLDALAQVPAFAVATLNPEPVLQGAYDRGLLGDFFEIALGPEGDVHAVWNARLAEGDAVVYARQAAGPRLAAPGTPPAAPGGLLAPVLKALPLPG